MENPGTLIRRALQNRRRKTVRTRDIPPGDPQPRHVSSHANYSALMRSHDRMNCRHIGGQSGSGRA